MSATAAEKFDAESALLELARLTHAAHRILGGDEEAPDVDEMDASAIKELVEVIRGKIQGHITHLQAERFQREGRAQ